MLWAATGGTTYGLAAGRAACWLGLVRGVSAEGTNGEEPRPPSSAAWGWVGAAVPLLILLSWLVKAGTARLARLRWRETGGAAVIPADAGQPGSNKYEKVGLPALVGSPTGAVFMADSPARGGPPAEAASLPPSPPQPAEALPITMDTASPRGATDPTCWVEDGVGWRIARNFAAEHDRHATLDVLMAYAREEAPQADDLDGPERLAGIKNPSGRKLLRFVGRRDLADLAEAMVKEVLPLTSIARACRSA